VVVFGERHGKNLHESIVTDNYHGGSADTLAATQESAGNRDEVLRRRRRHIEQPIRWHDVITSESSD
jgi:hypothetical protein